MDTLTPAEDGGRCPMRGWWPTMEEKTPALLSASASEQREEEECLTSVVDGTSLEHPPLFPPANVLSDSCDDSESYPVPGEVVWWVAPRYDHFAAKKRLTIVIFSQNMLSNLRIGERLAWRPSS